MAISPRFATRTFWNAKPRLYNPGMRSLLLILLIATAANAQENWTWWVQDCTAEAAKATGCDAKDPELARWALEAWARESAGKIKMTKSATKQAARIRINWASGEGNLYGEARPIRVNGERGAEIYVLPDIHALGGDIERGGLADRLFRDAVVYLTCVHESGHALGLEHTNKFVDIMYTFRYGGDFVEYFGRYRRQLKKREDIAGIAGISEADRLAVRR